MRTTSGCDIANASVINKFNAHYFVPFEKHRLSFKRINPFIKPDITHADWSGAARRRGWATHSRQKERRRVGSRITLYLSSSKLNHITSDSTRGAWRGGGTRPRKHECRQNSSPTKHGSLEAPKVSKTRRLNLSREVITTQTSI